MLTILTGVVAGIAMFAFRLFEGKKKKKELNELLKKSDYQHIDHSRTFVMLLCALMIVCGFVLYTFVQAKDQFNIALSIFLILAFASEAINAKSLLQLYYNDDGIIVDGKATRYRSMKSLHKSSSLPFGRYKLITFKGEQLNIHREAAEIIKKHTNL